ncbi:MAG TPA: hypothetical protein VG474_11775, partial [Solirubrobacteraceae bacterium]|nr:hypothetical protein [Solirubrobacteraceae bacterium]
VLLPVAGFAALAGRLPLLAALAGVLAALWMAATHAPLVAQALDGQVAADAAAWHSAPGFALVVLTSAAAVLAWLDEGAQR